MNVLFIGNSYTFYHEMPVLFENLAKANQKKVTVDSVTRGGRRLYENLVCGDAEHEKIAELLQNKSYDVLFLQEQSYHALVDYGSFEEGVLGLAKLVDANRTVLYATWGRKSGCDLLDKYGWTSEQMGQKLHEAYSSAAQKCGAEVSPVGLAFNAINLGNSDIELYAPDLSHPSRTGSVLVTVMHYKTVFGELPINIDSLGVTKEEADVILDTVAALV